MGLSINTNAGAILSTVAAKRASKMMDEAMIRLSTGKRINSAADDAAGLAIGKDLESRVSGLNQAIRNVNDGISMVQITEGALDEATTILQRMRDLAVQAANGSLTTVEQGYLDTEHEKLATALNDVVNQAKFDDITLIDNTATASDDKNSTKTLQIGADAGETLGVVFQGLSDVSLGVSATDIALNGSAVAETVAFDTFALGGTHAANDKFKLTVGSQVFETDAAASNTTFNTEAKVIAALQAKITAAGVTDFSIGTDLTITYARGGDQTLNNSEYKIEKSVGAGATDDTEGAQVDGTADASGAINMIDKALALIADDRARLGATQAQLESTVRNLANVAENTSAAAGRIMDTDYAAETANLTKAQILQQAATSILAQANAQPQAVLSLLQ